MEATRPGQVRSAPGALSLVIPAFNEEGVIERAIWEADEALANVFGEYELLVVDDGSTDRTAVRAEALVGLSPRLRVLRHWSNRGYGAALRTGFEAARFPLVAFTDADCQFDLADLDRLAAATSDVPIAVGYRVDRQDTWRRRFLSRGYNRLTRNLLGTRVRDCDCALKVFRREILADLLPESRGFFVNAEMLTRARQQGHDLIELPVAHRPRAGGESKVALTEIPRTFGQLLTFWWQAVVRGQCPTGPTILTARLKGANSSRRPSAAPPRESGPGHRAELPESCRESA